MNPIISFASKPGVYSPTGTRKRSRSVEGRRKLDPSRVPTLPNLPGNLILQVLTHKSLRRPGASGEGIDNEKLGDLGKTAFDLAVTQHLFRKRPMLEGYEIYEQSRKLLESGIVEDWMAHYRLMDRLCCPKSTSKEQPEEICSLFYAYVGGLFVTSGPAAVNFWIDQLLSQENIEPVSAIKPDSYEAISIPPPQKRAKSETMSPPPSIYYAAQPPPLLTPRAPKHPPSHIPTPPNPLSPAQPHAAFLPLFNEAAMKRRVTVEYLADFSGPPHAGRWTVKCIVNGISKGEGSSSHKQTAKEEAARNAYYSMGWQ